MPTLFLAHGGACLGLSGKLGGIVEGAASPRGPRSADDSGLLLHHRRPTRWLDSST